MSAPTIVVPHLGRNRSSAPAPAGADPGQPFVAEALARPVGAGRQKQSLGKSRVVSQAAPELFRGK